MQPIIQITSVVPWLIGAIYTLIVSGSGNHHPTHNHVKDLGLRYQLLSISMKVKKVHQSLDYFCQNFYITDARKHHYHTIVRPIFDIHPIFFPNVRKCEGLTIQESDVISLKSSFHPPVRWKFANVAPNSSSILCSCVAWKHFLFPSTRLFTGTSLRTSSNTTSIPILISSWTALRISGGRALSPSSSATWLHGIIVFKWPDHVYQ